MIKAVYVAILTIASAGGQVAYTKHLHASYTEVGMADAIKSHFNSNRTMVFTSLKDCKRNAKLHTKNIRKAIRTAAKEKTDISSKHLEVIRRAERNNALRPHERAAVMREGRERQGIVNTMTDIWVGNKPAYKCVKPSTLGSLMDKMVGY